MKKLLLCLTILSLSTLSAKNKIVKDSNGTQLKPTELCGVSVTFYDEYGYVTGWKFYSAEKSSFGDCLVYQGSVIGYLRSKGYRVEMTKQNYSLQP
jgi:hypothetical protein